MRSGVYVSGLSLQTQLKNVLHVCTFLLVDPV